MKVAVIGHKQIPGRSGGVEVVVEELATRLAARGFSVTAYNRKIKGKNSLKEFEGVRLIDIPTPDSKKLNAVVYSYLATVRAIMDGADLFHYHALGPAASLWLAKLFGKKVVVTVHGLNYKTPKWKGFGAKYIKFGEKIAAKYADRVIVLSRSIQEFFHNKYGRECDYIPNGLSMPEEIRDDSVLDRLQLRNKEFLLCVSRLVPGKGLEALVEAYKSVDSEAELIIAGDSDHVEEFKSALIESAADDDRIRFVGFVGKEDLSALYAAARLFVFPSEAEGMPMCLLEAMWFNCPCLVSDIEENIEVLGEFGHFFHVGNIADLYHKIELALQERRMGANTRELIAERNDWEKIADKTAWLYSDI